MDKITQVKYSDNYLFALYQSHLFIIYLQYYSDQYRHGEYFLKKMFKVDKFERQYDYKIMATNIKSFDCEDLIKDRYLLYYLTIDGILYGIGNNVYHQINSTDEFDVDLTFISHDIDSFVVSWYNQQLFVLNKNGNVYTRGGHPSVTFINNIKVNDNYKNLTLIHSKVKKIALAKNNSYLIILTDSNKLIITDFIQKNLFIREIQLDPLITQLHAYDNIYFIQNKQLKISSSLHFLAHREISIDTIANTDSFISDNGYIYFNDGDKVFKYNPYQYIGNNITNIDNCDFACENAHISCYMKQSKITIKLNFKLDLPISTIDLAWTPQTHHLYPSSVRQTIIILMMIQRRLKKQDISIDKNILYIIFRTIF